MTPGIDAGDSAPRSRRRRSRRGGSNRGRGMHPPPRSAPRQAAGEAMPPRCIFYQRSAMSISAASLQPADEQPDQRCRHRAQQAGNPTNQASTGLVSTTYAGLGSGAAVSLDLEPGARHLQTWQNNINQATGTMQVTQTAMTQIQSIASNFYSQITTWRRRRIEVDTIAASAQAALAAGGRTARYAPMATRMYSAARTPTNPPVPDPDQHPDLGLLYPDQRRRSATWQPMARRRPRRRRWRSPAPNATGTSPFSAYLSQPAATLQAADAARPGRPGPDGCRSGCWPAPTASVDLDRQLDDRFLHARPDARAGHHRLAEQLAGRATAGSRGWCRTPAPACKARSRRWPRTPACWATPRRR